MNNPKAVHGRVGGRGAEPQRDPDDFDLEAWFKDQTLPMQLGPAHVVRLKQWLEAHGFAAVEVNYRPKPDKFRVIMRRGTAGCCADDEQAETWLLRAAEACGSEAEQVIALLTADGKVLGSFKLVLPQSTWAKVAAAA